MQSIVTHNKITFAKRKEKTMVKTNYAKAVKSLIKVNKSKFLFYQEITEENSLVTDGRCIITVPTPILNAAAIEKNIKLEEKNNIKNILESALDYPEKAERSRIIIQYKKNNYVIYKSSDNQLIAVDKNYLDIAADVDYIDRVDIMHSYNSVSPLVSVDKFDGKIFSGFVICPVRLDTQKIIENLLA